jgi:hypothetical protein
MKLVPAVVASLAISACLAACSEDPPAVCDSVASLRASVDDVTQVDLRASGGLSDLQSGLDAVGDDLAQVKSDAAAEFGSQVDTVEASYDELTSSIESATGSPSADAVRAAGAALSAFGADVEALANDVQTTC